MNLIVIRPTIQAIVALTFANYALKPVYYSCDPPQAAVKLLAALCISKWEVLLARHNLSVQLHMLLYACISGFHVALM